MRTFLYTGRISATAKMADRRVAKLRQLENFRPNTLERSPFPRRTLTSI